MTLAAGPAHRHLRAGLGATRRKEDDDMPIRKYKPTSPGRRSMSVSTFEEITKKRPEKSLIEPLQKHAGRNNRGRITTRHRGGGAQAAATASSTSSGTSSASRPASPRSSTTRTAPPASRSCFYVDGEKRYILAPVGIKVGDMVVSGPDAPIRVGNALPLRNIPTGTQIHNIELYPGKGGQMVRSAGTSAQLMAKVGELRPGPHAVRRSSPGSPRLHGDAWPGRQRRPREHRRSARPAAPATWASARPCADR